MRRRTRMPASVQRQPQQGHNVDSRRGPSGVAGVMSTAAFGPPTMLALQPLVGNAALSTFNASAPQRSQASLVVRGADDRCEREADRVASDVTAGFRAGHGDAAASKIEVAARPSMAMRRRDAAAAPAAGVRGGPAGDQVANGVEAARGSGAALPPQTRARFESAFGSDFGQVRVHETTDSDFLSRSIGARAFTTGSDIFFRRGEYQPQSSAGEELLAHELTHVVQQSTGAPQTVQRKLGFEFESGNLTVGEEIKEKFFEDPDIRIEPDSGGKKGAVEGNNIEFVIKEADDYATTKRRLDKASEVANDLSAQQARRNGPFLTREAGGLTFKRNIELYVHDTEWMASPQVTVGVLLEQMGSYLYEATDRSSDKGRRGDVQRIRDEEETAGGPRGGPTKADGLVVLIRTFLKTLGDWNKPEADEGPKNAFVAMSRTNFRAMVANLNLGEDAKQQLKQRVLRAAFEERGQLDQLVIRNPQTVVYDTGPKAGQQEETTIQEWIDSIFAYEHKIEIGGATTTKVDSDEMSPPDLQRNVDPRYSMGALGMDGNLVLLEERLNDLYGNEIALSDWYNFAISMFDAEHDRFKQQPGAVKNSEGDVKPPKD